MKSANVRMMHVGGRELRVATWRLGMPSEHLPVLFFNGIGANIEAVAPLAEALDDRGFVMFDMPGVGGSPEPTVPYNPFTMGWTTARLLDQLGLEQVDVMGVSWGGAMAQHFALQHGSRVRRLILCATTAGMLMVPGSPAALLQLDPGDVIASVNGQPVASMEQLNAAVANSPDEMRFDIVNIKTGKPQALLVSLARPVKVRLR